MTEQKDHNLDLNTPAQFIKGVGPNRAKTFAQLGVNTLADLLEYYPRDWVFMPEPIKIEQARPKQTATIVGLIEQTDFLSYRRTPMFEAVVADDTAACRIIWFHGGYLKNKLQPGQIIMASGKFTTYKHQLQLTNPKFIILDSYDQIDPDFFNGPVYPASAKLSSIQIKRIITPLLKDIEKFVPEFYEPTLRKKANLISRPDAFKQIHAPDDEDKLARAKRRLKYDELFLMQLGLALKRRQARDSSALKMNLTDKIDSRIRKRFPFLLTEDQNTVIDEIASDMARTTPMNRLLQGDVSSGKTVVALYAALLAVANKSQVAIMAPTEILADQHMTSIERFLKNSKVTRTLITGAVTGKNREQIINKISAGQIDIVVGTVALLNEKIDFANLGLVIIDEQHKFGVHQRAALRKGKTPHCLVMTATPIPRTLAMTAFGDLDVSTIKHSPPGRGEIITKWVQPHDRPKALDFIRQRLKAKKQAYFVYPRIESEDNTETKAAIDEHKALSKEFSEFNVALLHGQMPAERKNSIMKDFRAGKINVLVSTIVIEVGIDVPNATIMVIENANRFGLAQLHQLRGRIGRGQSKSYCLLFAETEDETAKSRLEIMTRSNDGFEIAEHDLKIRGPGELFSARQHGLPDLKIANIIDDFELLTLARRNAFEMVCEDPALVESAHRNIRAALIEKFGDKITLADIA
jgi:ATP-dependent DNA helicase RecG